MTATLSCTRVRRALSPFRDGRLPPRAASAVREHLVACRACRRENAALARLSAGVLALPVTVPAPGLADRVRAAAGGSRVRVARRWRWLAAGCLAGGLLWGAFELGRLRERSATPPNPVAGDVAPVPRTPPTGMSPKEPGVAPLRRVRADAPPAARPATPNALAGQR
ncbi:MAG: zf-HC2 domain-containing protein [bacterium]|nr:zf-HC2 domain-containing protein [bacterium]